MHASAPEPYRRREYSIGLNKFVEEYPFERVPILEFVADAARRVDAGSRVADIGAGMAPYAELWDHTEYVTIDWEQSQHGLDSVDIVASADAVPVIDASFDTAIMTQVLEHVPNPADVLTEVHRLLRPGGLLFVSVPLAWELHELPHDYYRYTQRGLEVLLADAGFTDVEVRARNDCFTTLAQLLLNARWAMGFADDGLDGLRAGAIDTLEDLAGIVARLAPLDVRHIFPLGYTAMARRSGADD
jgi:SAM-dependent methyltransferase